MKEFAESLWLRAQDALRVARHVSPDEAAETIEIAADIVRAVSESAPDTFPGPEGS